METEDEICVIDSTKVAVVGRTKSNILTSQHNPNIFARQILCALSMLLMTIFCSTVSGYSGTLLPQLEMPDTKISITRGQQSWIAAMAPFLMFLGCLFSSWTMDKFGRKRSNIGSTILGFSGWTIIYFSNTFEMLLVGRVICGLFVGLCVMSVTAYLAEASAIQYRGIFLSFLGLGISLGVFIVHLCGTFLNWQNTALAILVIPTILLTVLPFLPESHVWYINQHNFVQARKSFYWLRGSSPEAIDEIESLIQKYNAPKKSTLEVLSECRKQEFYKPLIILLLFFITAQLSGPSFVAYYSIEIMRSTVPTLNKYASMLLVDAIRVIAAIAASWLIKRFKVRPLLFTSAIGSVVSLVSLGCVVHLIELHPQQQYLSVIALILFISYILFISIGLIPLPWTTCGELLPPLTKGIGGGIACATNFLSIFAVVKVGPVLLMTVGIAVTFCIFGTCVTAGTIYLYFVLPETKNQTLQQIQEHFKPKETLNK